METLPTPRSRTQTPRRTAVVWGRPSPAAMLGVAVYIAFLAFLAYVVTHC